MNEPRQNGHLNWVKRMCLTTCCAVCGALVCACACACRAWLREGSAELDISPPCLPDGGFVLMSTLNNNHLILSGSVRTAGLIAHNMEQVQVRALAQVAVRQPRNYRPRECFCPTPRFAVMPGGWADAGLVAHLGGNASGVVHEAEAAEHLQSHHRKGPYVQRRARGDLHTLAAQAVAPLWALLHAHHTARQLHAAP